MSLADLFPPEYLEPFKERGLDPQSILLIRVPQFELNYDKWIVVVGKSDCGNYLGCSAVNTNPSPKNEHVVITQTSYPFLDYDSHMNCTGLVDMDINYLREEINRDPGIIVGSITNEEYSRLVQTLRNSRIMTTEQKIRYNLI
jgi:hypothetical protein